MGLQQQIPESIQICRWGASCKLVSPGALWLPCSPVLDEAVAQSSLGLELWVAVKVQPVGHAGPRHCTSRRPVQLHTQEDVCLDVRCLLQYG